VVVGIIGARVMDEHERISNLMRRKKLSDVVIEASTKKVAIFTLGASILWGIAFKFILYGLFTQNIFFEIGVIFGLAAMVQLPAVIIAGLVWLIKRDKQNFKVVWVWTSIIWGVFLGSFLLSIF
jgi:hypothetical protein